MVKTTRHEIKHYKGRRQWNQYLTDLRNVEWGTVSYNGAALMLRVSVQRIHQLVRAHKVRAWLFIEDYSLRPGYAEVSVYDLIDYGLKTGRLRGPKDLGLGFPEAENLFNILKDSGTLIAN